MADENKTPLFNEDEQKNASLRNELGNLKDVFDQTIHTNTNVGNDVYRKAKIQGVNLAGPSEGGLNYERYYNKNAYSRLGFNPLRDNEAYYNDNSSAWEDLIDARSQWSNLAGLGFNTLWSSKSDRDEAREYERYSNIGTSSRKGLGADMNNAFLNSGYTIGLLSEIAAEELALSLVSAATLGAASPALAATTARNTVRAKQAFGMAEDMTSIIGRVRDLTDISKANTTWNMAKKVGNVINPLRGTTEYLTAGRALDKADGLSNFARNAKTFGAFYRDLREVRLAFDEGELESGFVSNGVRDDLVLEHIEKTGEHPEKEDMIKINEQALQAKKNTLATNSMLIYATNRISFGNMFNKYMPRAIQDASMRGINSRVVKNIKTGKMTNIKQGGILGYKTLVNEVKHAATNLKTMPLATAKLLGKYTRANVGEGVQEYFQEVIQDAEDKMAKDRYYGAISGGAWYNALHSDAYMSQYGKSLEKFQSEEGWDVFKGGFLMGIFAGPFGRVSQSLTRTLDKHGKWVYDREGYIKAKADEAKAEEKFDKEIQTFNDMTDSRKDFLYDYIHFLRRQAADKVEMDKAADDGDQKRFRDIKDAGLAAKVLFAQRMGGEDLLMGTLKDLGQMSPEDLQDAFGDNVKDDPTFAKDYLESQSKIIERAERIMGFSKDFDKLFPAPNFNMYSQSDFGEAKVQRDYIESARYQAKLLAITNQEGLVRTMERMSSIMNNAYNKAPYWDASNSPIASDITKIFNGFEMQEELGLLDDEIAALQGFSPKTIAQRKELGYKKRMRALLAKFSDKDGVLDKYLRALQGKEFLDLERKQIEDNANLEVGKQLRYRRGNTTWGGDITGESVDSKGRPQWIIKKDDGTTSKILKSSTGIVSEQFDEEAYDNTLVKPLEELKSIFRKYMELVGSNTGNSINNTKFDEAFNDFKDFYALTEDKKNLTETVSYLTDPGGHYALVERFNKMNEAKRQNMSEEVKAQLEQYQQSVDTKALINMLADDYGVYIDEDQLKALDEDNQIPTDFYDINTNEPLRFNTETYKQVRDAITTYLKGEGKIDEEVTATEEDVSTETKAEEQIKTKIAISVDTPFEEWIEYNGVRANAEDLMNTYNIAAKANGAPVYTDVEEYLSDNNDAKKQVIKTYNDSIKEKDIQPKAEETVVEESTEEATEEAATKEVTPKITATAEDVANSNSSGLSDSLEEQVFNNEIKFLSLETNDPNTKALIEPLSDGKRLPKKAAISDLKPGAELTISKQTADNKITYVTLIYRGMVSFKDLTIEDPINELDLKSELDLKYAQEAWVDGKKYFAPSFGMGAWVGGRAKLHVFEVANTSEKKTATSKDTIEEWRDSVISRFNTTDNIEKTLLSIQQENIERKAEGKPALGTKELTDIYDGLITEFKGSLTLDNIKLQDHYRVKAVKVDGKNVNFGTAKVIEVGTTGITIESTGTKTQGMTKFINEESLKDVLKSKIERTTDLQEDLSKVLTEDEQAIVKENNKSADIFAKDNASIKKSIAKTKTQSTKEVDDNFFNELGCE